MNKLIVTGTLNYDVYSKTDKVELLLKWAADGWLHIVPGRTFDPAVAVNRIIELDAKNVNFFGFGYDPYNAKTVINHLYEKKKEVKAQLTFSRKRGVKGVLV